MVYKIHNYWRYTSIPLNFEFVVWYTRKKFSKNRKRPFLEKYLYFINFLILYFYLENFHAFCWLTRGGLCKVHSRRRGLQGKKKKAHCFTGGLTYFGEDLHLLPLAILVSCQSSSWQAFINTVLHQVLASQNHYKLIPLALPHLLFWDIFGWI